MAKEKLEKEFHALSRTAINTANRNFFLNNLIMCRFISDFSLTLFAERICPCAKRSEKHCESIAPNDWKTMSIRRKTVFWIIGILLSPVVVVTLLAVLLYIPPVQNWAVKTVARMASESTGMDISVGHVRLCFPLDLALDDVDVLRQNDSLPQVKDTIVDLRRAKLDVEMLPLLKLQVNIDNLELEGLKLNTATLIASTRIKGNIENLKLSSHGIWLKGDSLKVEEALMDSVAIDVALSDTVPPDTTESENFWKIYAQKISVKRTNVTVHMPGDTLQVAARIGEANAEDGFFDLHKSLYRLRSFALSDGAIAYDNNFKTFTTGIDPNHISLSDVNIKIDSLYYCDPNIHVGLTACSFKEKSGIIVNDISAPISLDSTTVTIPSLNVVTPESKLQASMKIDMNAFDDTNPGTLEMTIHGAVGKQDIMRFMGDMPQDFKRRWPNYQLSIDGVVRGNMRHARLTAIDIKLPTAFRLRADGTADNIDDTDRLKANININAEAYNLAFISSLTGNSFAIPSGTTLNGNVKADGANIATTFTLKQGGGSLTGKAGINTHLMAYNADMKATAFPVQNFVKGMGLRPLTASLNVNGKGTDIVAASTKVDGNAAIKRFGINGYAFENIAADVKIQRGVVHATIDSDNTLLSGLVNFDALMSTKKIQATVSGDIYNIDFYKLGLTKNPLTASLCAYIDLASDMSEYHKLKGTLGDLTVRDSANVYRPGDIDVDLLTRRDTTHAVVNSGDFKMAFNASGGYKALLESIDDVSKEMTRQIDKRYIDYALMRSTLPTAKLSLQTGSDNLVVRTLKRFGYSIDDAYADIATSPTGGINGDLAIDKLIAGGIQIDTVRLSLASDSTMMNYHGRVCNNKKNPQYVFNALFNGGQSGNSAFMNAKIFDADNQLGVQTGLTAAMEEKGIRLSLDKNDQIWGYKKFSVNDNNYLFLGNDQHVSADLKLIADDGMGLQCYTNDETDALQDISLSLNKFDLERILSVVPYAPNITGVMNGDFHLIQTSDELSVSSDITVDKMTYERSAIGDVETEFVYMPKGDGTHYVDGTLSIDDRETAVISGTYDSAGEGSLNAEATLNQLPLSIVNGFIPDRIIGLRGNGDGTLTVKGSLSKPQIDGEVFLDSCFLFSEPYGVELRFDDDPVAIVGSHLLFENFEMYSHNDSPFTIAGSLDFSDLDNMMLDIRMRAQNFKLIDAKENFRSEAYGQAFVNFFGMMRGRLDNLTMRGKLDVLGSTDMTYVLRDTPLSNDNQLEGLVEFTDFADTTTTTPARPTLSGFDMDLTLSVDEGARVVCMLNADKSNYIDVQGGGDLRMQYNPTDDLRLTGRYTLSNGEMKYSLPVIPLKTFSIQEGSYVEFLGDAMNPRLNITATEETKATVGSSSQGYSVAFECGVKITKTLQDMGLEFIIDAPNDMSVHTQLASMSTEERGKAAVTMLTTGMYIVDGNTSSFSMNSALSAFLNSQITSITGSALRTLDMSLGVDNTTTSTGGTQTDYSFKFAKRFWNNRLRITVGGKLSTGADVEGQNEQFFNNITFEYRMNQNSTKYLKLFYSRDSYDWLEGNVGEYGAGFLWRRKLRHFKDIFRLKEESDTPQRPPAASDSLKRSDKQSSDEKTQRQ